MPNNHCGRIRLSPLAMVVYYIITTPVLLITAATLLIGAILFITRRAVVTLYRALMEHSIMYWAGQLTVVGAIILLVYIASQYFDGAMRRIAAVIVRPTVRDVTTLK